MSVETENEQEWKLHKRWVCLCERLNVFEAENNDDTLCGVVDLPQRNELNYDRWLLRMGQMGQMGLDTVISLYSGIENPIEQCDKSISHSFSYWQN